MVLELICGIPDGTNAESLLLKIEELSEKKGRQLKIKRCKSKMEVEYAVYCAGQESVVLLQEMFKRDAPYYAWEVAALRDIRELPVVMSVFRKHYATSYLSILYAAGILDVIFEEDASAGNLTERIFARRNRKLCREYYGIGSVKEPVATLSIIEEETLKRYIQHISGAADWEGIAERYHNIRKKLNFIENCFLTENLPYAVIEELVGEPGFSQYKSPEKNRRRKRYENKNLR